MDLNEESTNKRIRMEGWQTVARKRKSVDLSSAQLVESTWQICLYSREKLPK